MFETFPLQAALGFAGSSTVESYLVPQSQRGQNWQLAQQNKDPGSPRIIQDHPGSYKII